MKHFILNTLQKEIRSKTLLFLFIFTVIVIYGAFAFVTNFMDANMPDGANNLSGGGTVKLFLSILGAWTSILTILLGVGLCKNDEEENVLHQLLALPIKRSHYLLARIVGGVLLILSLYLFSSLFIMFLFSMKEQSIIGFVPLVSSLYSITMMMSCVLMISLFYSFYLPKVFAAIATLISLGFISNANSVYEGAGKWGIFLEGGLLTKLWGLVHTFLPPAGSWGTLNSMILSDTLEWDRLLLVSGQSFFSFILFFLFLNFLFNKREI